MGRTESLYAVFKRSPEEALEQTFVEGDARAPYMRGVTMYQALAGVPPDTTTYGSYKIISRASLKDRKYRIEFWDDAVSIFWLDVQHDRRTYKSVPVIQ